MEVVIMKIRSGIRNLIDHEVFKEWHVEQKQTTHGQLVIVNNSFLRRDFGSTKKNKKHLAFKLKENYQLAEIFIVEYPAKKTQRSLFTLSKAKNKSLKISTLRNALAKEIKDFSPLTFLLLGMGEATMTSQFVHQEIHPALNKNSPDEAFVYALNDELRRYNKFCQLYEAGTNWRNNSGQLLNVVIDFTRDVLPYLKLVTSIGDLYPIILWGTIFEHFWFAESIKEVNQHDGQSKGKKPSLIDYVSTIQQLESAPSQAIYPFKAFLESETTSDSGDQADQKQLGQQGKRKKAELALKELLSQYSWAGQQDISLDFFLKNESIMERATYLLSSNTSFLQALFYEQKGTTDWLLLEWDELIREAAQLVIGQEVVYTDFIQRHLKVDYHRADIILNQLEKLGIVGAHYGKQHARDVIPNEEGFILEAILHKINIGTKNKRVEQKKKKPAPLKGLNLNDPDPLLKDAAKLIVGNQHGSTSMIQRRLKLGYNRASQIMSQLETLGIVGPVEGSKPREVLVSDEAALAPVIEQIKPNVPAAGETEIEMNSPTLGVAESSTSHPTGHKMHFQAGNKDHSEPRDPALELPSYQYPSAQLLEDLSHQKVEVGRAELEANKDQIIETLLNYKIEISKIRATVGPAVTLYEIEPAPGVRISKIKNLEDDIALSLSELRIRIIAPIPGKGTVGIEVPNKNAQTVSMRELLSHKNFKQAKMDLPIALGKTISNEIFVADLAKMPHLLLAGAAGQGKSAGINSILLSILYKKHPSQVKLVLIYPKKVELFPYSHLEHHFLGFLPGQDEPITSETKKAIHTLNSLCIEMDQRYDLLKKASARNIKEYNQKFVDQRLNPEKGHRFMPFIVLVIDEFADLIMTAGKEIELPIGRLAQLARAVGIHLIIATQRPSVNIITGVIKANFPARIAYKVTAKVDSRTILDSNGADHLIGKGDMLLRGDNEMVRIQGAVVDKLEIERVVDFIQAQQGYPNPYSLPELHEVEDVQGDSSLTFTDLDDRFEEAARVIVRYQQGSTSLLQRRLKLGYNRAGRIMDQLEAAGIVGPSKGAKPREVLVSDEIELDRFLQEIIDKQ